MNIKKKISEHGKTHIKIDLETLIQFMSDKEYPVQHETIKELIDENIISAIKSAGTNGKIYNPLYKKYKISKQQSEYPEARKNIENLHPKILANGYINKHPYIYNENQDILENISRFLYRRQGSRVSKKERSFDIFSDEKLIENTQKLFSKININSCDLEYYETPEYTFLDYIPHRANGMTILICENKDIWYNIRKIMFEEQKFFILGVKFDGVLYGQGNSIDGKDKLLAYSNFFVEKDIKYYYCGDIDQAGFDIFNRLHNKHRDTEVFLFVELYILMVKLAEDKGLLKTNDKRNINHDFDFLNQLPYDLLVKINRILFNKERLPQEIINYNVLKEVMTK